MGLELQTTQVQSLSPRMIQNLEIIQMNAQELLDYVNGLVQENPVIELERPREEPAAEDKILQTKRLLEQTDGQNRWYTRADTRERGELFEEASPVQETLADHIRAQLSVEEPLRRAVELLTESLDSNGWLKDGLEELSRAGGVPLAELEQALSLIQSVEPAGVGARDLQECLLLQLRRQTPEDVLTVRIVQDYLPELAKSHYNAVAKALKVSQAEVRRSLDHIRELNPRPGNGFSSTARTHYVMPDLIAIPCGDWYELVVNDTYLPRLNLSGYYTRLLGESQDADVTAYLTDKLRQAEWAISAIQQRKDTMLRCMETILELQSDYFYRDGPVRPLRQADVAGRMGVHESTVSRAIRGKWLQCPKGIVPLSKFFSQEVAGGAAGEEISVREAKRRLKVLIQKENPASPLSDQKLCELLANDGCMLSRRTVAKYRSEMGYPPATGRKRC